MNPAKLNITYPPNVEPNDWSHAELYSIVDKATIMDTDLDACSLGIYLRLGVICYFKQDWRMIYEMADEETVDYALNQLQEQHYIKLVKKDEEVHLVIF